MKLLVIVPTNRRTHGYVMRLWRAQTVHADLVWAPSPAVIVPPEYGPSVRQTTTIGEARNAGLEYARAHGYTHAIFWDDDNYYGPAYVEEFAEAFDLGACLVHKPIGFVRHDDGLWWYDESRTNFCPGHCTGVSVQIAAEFPARSLAEDVAWTKLMAGYPRTRIDGWGLVYDRRAPAGHAYAAEQAIFLRAHGPARYLGQAPDAVADCPFVTDAPWQQARDEDVFEAMARRAGTR